jgi:hypothetical protein
MRVPDAECNDVAESTDNAATKDDFLADPDKTRSVVIVDSC